MLDDGEPQSGAAGRARSASVDTIEALGQTRNVLVGDADTGVDDAEFAAVGAHPPSERNTTAIGRVAYRVAHEVAERARELVAAADHVGRIADVERDLVPAVGERLRVGRYLQQQRHDRELRFVRHAVLALQRRKREKIVDQPLHISRLLGHEREIALPLPLLEPHVGECLQEAGQHGERRLELVRNVGDEVAPHARHGLEPRDVAAHQKLLLDAERHDLDGECGAGLSLRFDNDRLAEITPDEVLDEGGLPDEVDDWRAGILTKVHAEMRLRAPVGPLDAIGGVE